MDSFPKSLTVIGPVPAKTHKDNEKELLAMYRQMLVLEIEKQKAKLGPNSRLVEVKINNIPKPQYRKLLLELLELFKGVIVEAEIEVWVTYMDTSYKKWIVLEEADVDLDILTIRLHCTRQDAEPEEEEEQKPKNKKFKEDKE